MRDFTYSAQAIVNCQVRFSIFSQRIGLSSVATWRDQNAGYISSCSLCPSSGSDRTEYWLGESTGGRFGGLPQNTGCARVEKRHRVETKGKYSVELFKEGGEGAGQEEIVDQHDNLTVARAIYRGRVSQYPTRLVMLRDRARVLARSDRPETMP